MGKGGFGQMGDGVMGCGVFRGAGEISTIAGGMSQLHIFVF